MPIQKQRRSDDTASRGSMASSGLESAVLGTVAGGLVLGALQSRESQPLADESTHLVIEPATIERAEISDTPPAAPSAESGGDEVTQLAASSTSAPSSASNFAEPAPSFTVIQEAPVEHTPLTQSGGEPGVRAEAVERAAVQTQAQAGAREQSVSATADEAVTLVSSHISGMVDKIVASSNPDSEPLATLDIAEAVTSTARQIVNDLDTAGLSQIEPAVDAILAPLEDLSSQVDAVASIPLDILGSEEPISDGGLLSSIFYSDGGSEDLMTSPQRASLGEETLAIPDVSDLAGNLTGSIVEAPIALLGTSYSEVQNDPLQSIQGASNALGLL